MSDFTESTLVSPLKSPAPDSNVEANRAYLLVFEGESASMVAVTAEQGALIGRSPECEVCLKDPNVSRHHARVSLRDATARVADLDSQNGTRVNGERIAGERQLLSGDTIRIGTVTIVLHVPSVVRPRHVVLELPAFFQRLGEELERAVRYRRPLSLVAISFEKEGADVVRLRNVVFEQLRLIDVTGWGSSELLLCMLPETSVEEALAAARRLIKAIGVVVRGARAGVSSCPRDGADANSLITAARLAAGTVASGFAAESGSTSKLLSLGGHEVVVADPSMIALYTLIERLAASELPVLIQGDTGSGKELAAHALHAWSKRGSKPMITVNCAALPPNLVESELFGHEKGAFSGAEASKVGLFEKASGGSIFLDEVGELPFELQAKLLRVLETKRLLRLGDTAERAADVRIIAATNRDLKRETDQGRFRQDLFFRLKGGQLWIPPLRDRKQEIAALARRFIADACKRLERAPLELSEDAIGLLSTYPWPGNVRELKNAIEYAVAVSHTAVIERSHIATYLDLPPETVAPSVPVKPPTPSSPPTFRPIDEEIEELEKGRMEAALAATRGNQTRAAELISMPLRTFVKKLSRYGLRS